MATATRKEVILGKLLRPARVVSGPGPIARAYEEAKQPKPAAGLAGPIRYVLSDGWTLAAVHMESASLFDGFVTEPWVEGGGNAARNYRILQNGGLGIVVTRGPTRAPIKNWVAANASWSYQSDWLIQVTEEDYDRWVASKGRLTLTTALPAFFRLPQPGRNPTLNVETVFVEVLAAKQEKPKAEPKQPEKPEDAFGTWMKEWIAKTKAKHLEAHDKLVQALAQETRSLFKHGDERKSAIFEGWERYNADSMVWERISGPTRKQAKKARKAR